VIESLGSLVEVLPQRDCFLDVLPADGAGGDDFGALVTKDEVVAGQQHYISGLMVAHQAVLFDHLALTAGSA
jgi:hypothetical protein